MKLGAFSISLAVKDIAASRAFYETLGFTVFGGNQDQHWLIMKSETTFVGPFQGVFEKNMLTFNPGWDSDARLVSGYDDVRAIQRKLKEHGIALESEADEASTATGKLHRDGSGRQPDPGRPACMKLQRRRAPVDLPGSTPRPLGPS